MSSRSAPRLDESPGLMPTVEAPHHNLMQDMNSGRSYQRPEADYMRDRDRYDVESRRSSAVLASQYDTRGEVHQPQYMATAPLWMQRPRDKPRSATTSAGRR
eukprot:3251228-Amphidinium_carterae.1